MIGTDRQQPQAHSSNTEELRHVFLLRVHELLQLGYQRMKAQAFAFREEPDITGELAREMNVALSEHDWGKSFWVRDEVPVNDGKRFGKHRNKIDIYVESSESAPRPQFSFEAKRLSHTKPAREYLGREGLGCFLEGDYAAEDSAAGMLGYIQSKLPQEWAQELEERLMAPDNPYRLTAEGYWRSHPFPRGPSHSYMSEHQRTVHGRIAIYHTLLVFH